jgi:hypothetical protein
MAVVPTVKRQQVPTVIGFKHSYFSPISSGHGGSDRNTGNGSAAKPIVVRKLSPLSPKHIVGPVGNGVKPAPPVKPDHLKSPPMSPVPSEEVHSNRSSPLHHHHHHHPLRSASNSTSSLPSAAAADAALENTAASPSLAEEEIPAPSELITPTRGADSPLCISDLSIQEVAEVVAVSAAVEEPLAETETPPADSGPASLGAADSGPTSLSEEAGQVVANQLNGSNFVELLPDEQER